MKRSIPLTRAAQWTNLENTGAEGASEQTQKATQGAIPLIQSSRARETEVTGGWGRGTE